MKRVALVVQRCHESIVGGSEALAWQYANILRSEFEVEILTSTAMDCVTWKNELPEGVEHREGIIIRRFPVTIARSEYWHTLHHRLINAYKDLPQNTQQPHAGIPWTIALQEEFIRHQGPHCEGLIQFLREHSGDYQSIIFVTYLYPTTYFGLSEVPISKVLLVPTLHDEPVAYLAAYKNMAVKAQLLIWLTHAESKLGQQLWGDLPGEEISMAIETQPFPPHPSDYPYILYSGRIDDYKGCSDLMNDFIQFKQDYPSNLKLVLTGKDSIPIPKHKDIEFRGFVSEEEKFRLMSGASVFVMPSPYESLSIITLEAMAQKTPVLVNGLSEVLAEHVVRSQGGKVYTDYSSFAAALQMLLSQNNQEMGSLARTYVLDNYAFESVQKRLIAAVNQCA